MTPQAKEQTPLLSRPLSVPPQLNPLQETLEARRRQLRFRAWHRGTREADLLLGPFADSFLPHGTPEEVEDFARLLEAEDPDVWDWITGQKAVPAAYETSAFKALQQFIVLRAEGNAASSSGGSP